MQKCTLSAVCYLYDTISPNNDLRKLLFVTTLSWLIPVLTKSIVWTLEYSANPRLKIKIQENANTTNLHITIELTHPVQSQSVFLDERRQIVVFWESVCHLNHMLLSNIFECISFQRTTDKPVWISLKGPWKPQMSHWPDVYRTPIKRYGPHRICYGDCHYNVKPLIYSLRNVSRLRL